MGNSIKLRIICVIVGKKFSEECVRGDSRIKWELKLGVGSVKNQHFFFSILLFFLIGHIILFFF